MQPVADTPAVFAECPVWLARSSRLCWIDCAGARLFSLDWSSRTVSTLTSEPGVLYTGLVKYGDDGLLLVTTAGLRVVASDGIVRSGPLPATIEAALTNDCKADSDGRLWIGTVRSAPGRMDGALHCLATAGLAARAKGLGIPNGPAFDASGARLYRADSLARTIHGSVLEATGDLRDDRVLLSLSEGEGQPDGMTVDRRGVLFVALHGGSAILRLDPQTTAVDRIACPAAMPTSCVFGGPDLKTLFVTVANGPWPHDRRYPGTPPPVDASRPSLFTLTMGISGFSEPGVDLRCLANSLERAS